MAVAGLLSACQIAGGPGGAPVAVTPDRAVALFDAVCGASLPAFATAPEAMAQAGITRPSGDGTMSAADEDASFRIEDGPGLGQSCTMTVGTDDAAGTLAALRAVTGGVQDTPFGPAGLYRGRPALLIFPAAPPAADGRATITVRLLSER